MFALPTSIENDTNAAALGEAQFGALRGVSSGVYVTVSSGIKFTTVFNGVVHTGQHSMAG